MELKPNYSKVLVVDDDNTFTGHVRSWLEKEGFVVHVAEVGRAAIQRFTLYRPYAAVLLDLHMPKVDGFEVLRAIRQMDLDSPVFVLSGDYQAREKVIQLGADTFLQKPVSRETLCWHLLHSVKARSLSRAV